jgi:hypothetical protein
MKQTEIILGTAIILLMLSRLYFIYPLASLLISILTLFLAVLYLFLSFVLLNQIRLRNLFKKSAFSNISTLRIIGTIGTGFVLSIITINILFVFQRWPYGRINLLIGLIGIIPIIAFVIFKLVKKNTPFYKALIIRLAIISFIGLVLFFTKSETLLEMKFRDFPEYVEAEKNVMEDPSNLELQKIANKARQEMRTRE